MPAQTATSCFGLENVEVEQKNKEVEHARRALEEQAAEWPATTEEPPARTHHETINLLIVDDHTIVRQSLANMLRTQNDINILGEAGSGREAIQLADTLSPDIILMDVNLGDTSGLEVTKSILARHPGIKVIGLSMHDENEVAMAMRSVGAVAYLSKGVAAEDLISAIRNSLQPVSRTKKEKAPRPVGPER